MWHLVAKVLIFFFQNQLTKFCAFQGKNFPTYALPALPGRLIRAQHCSGWNRRPFVHNIAYRRYRQTDRTSPRWKKWSNPQKLLIKPKKMVTQLTAAMKRCFAVPSIFQNMMFCNVDGAAVVANATNWIVFLWGCWAFIYLPETPEILEQRREKGLRKRDDLHCLMDK